MFFCWGPPAPTGAGNKTHLKSRLWHRFQKRKRLLLLYNVWLTLAPVGVDGDACHGAPGHVGRRHVPKDSEGPCGDVKRQHGDAPGVVLGEVEAPVVPVTCQISHVAEVVTLLVHTFGQH